MKNLMMALVMVGGVLTCVAGCHKDDADGKTGAASADSTGVPECDDYVKKMQACLGKMPAAAKPAMESTFTATRDTFKANAATPEGKMALKSSCKQMTDSLAANPACKWLERAASPPARARGARAVSRRAMPTFEFLANELGPAVTAEAPDGGPLLDLCDAAHAPVEFSCRSASCGTCRVDVIAGAELLLPAKAEEREVLTIFESAATHRLACRAVAVAGPGRVRLAWAKD